MENIVYYDLETKRFISELDVRKLLFDLEIGDIFNNIADYKDGIMNLEGQLNILKSSIHSNIRDVIEILNKSWNIEIKTYKEVE